MAHRPTALSFRPPSPSGLHYDLRTQHRSRKRRCSALRSGLSARAQAATKLFHRISSCPKVCCRPQAVRQSPRSSKTFRFRARLEATHRKWMISPENEDKKLKIACKLCRRVISEPWISAPFLRITSSTAVEPRLRVRLQARKPHELTLPGAAGVHRGGVHLQAAWRRPETPHSQVPRSWCTSRAARGQLLRAETAWRPGHRPRSSRARGHQPWPAAA